MHPQNSRPLSRAEKLDWLRLIRSENVGPVTFARLIERFGTAARALEAIPELSRRGGRAKPIAIASRAAAERELAEIERLGAQLIAACEPAYPPLLTQVEDHPPVLYVLGSPHLLARNAVAVVGSRNASAAGQRIARQMAMELGRAGLTVVSGLARGIDTAAHEASLASGTVAVVAGGPEVVYPPENARLHAAIAAQGAIIAEQPPGTVPQARHFPRRNRLISGLALGVVVVEASPKSGSLITARLAAEQGREVFAVPGSPLDGRSRGANQLIRDGATLVEDAGDVLSALAALRGRGLSEPPRPTPPPAAAPALPDENELEKARAAILRALSPVAVTVDEIVRQCQLSPGVAAVVLLELELAGRLERHPGHRVSLLGTF